MTARLIPLLLILAFSQAYGADWQLIRKPTERAGGGYLQYDRASIVRNGNVVSVWTRAIYESPQDVPDMPSTKTHILASLTDFDCKQRTELTRRILYLSDDEAQIVLAEKGPYNATDVIPDTIKEKVLLAVCRRRAPPPVSPKRVAPPYA